MKKNKLYGSMFLGILIVLTLAAFASAEAEITTGLTEGKILIDVDYGDLGKDDERTKTLNYTTSLVVENKGSASEAVSLVLTDVTSGYTLTLSESSFTLGEAGSNTSTKTITLTSVVPINVDSGSHTIGKLKIGAKEYSIVTEVRPMLEMDDVKVYIDGAKEDTINNDDETISNVRPGRDVELRVDVKNIFNDDYPKGDISDIELSLKFKDEDSEDDFDGDVDEEATFDLDADKENQDISLKFKVPIKAAEGDYELLLRVEGEDDNKANHVMEWTINLEVDRKRDDVQIENAYLMTSTLKCARETQLKIKLTNFGSNEQKEIGLSVWNSALTLDKNFDNIYLSEDPEDEENSYTVTVPVTVAEEVAAGEYDIEVKAYIRGDEEVQSTYIKLKVEDCPETVPATTATETTTSTATAATTASTPATTTATTNEREVAVETYGGQQQTAQQQTGEATQPEATPLTGGEAVESTEIPYTQIEGIVIFMSVVIGLLVLLIILMLYTLVRVGRKE